MSDLTVGYWNMRGLGAPLRAMCFFADVQFTAACHPLVVADGKIEYMQTSWHSKEKSELKERNPLINLPYIIDNGKVITQSNSCLSYLGKKFNLLGTNDQEASECEQLLCEIYDLRNGMTGLAYGKDFTEEKAASVVNRQIKHGSLQKLELWLERNPLFSEVTPYLVGGHCTAPDFHLFEMLDQYSTLSTVVLKGDLFESLPKLKVFYEGWLKHEKMQKYFNSELHALPFNNLGAPFGSCKERGRTFNPETDTLHADATGVYPK